MYIIIAGAGIIGYQLTKILVANKHDVVVIDINRDVCETIYAETGAMAIHGSATDIGILEKSGASQADSILCFLRSEGDNIACVVLSKSLGIPNIVALLREPQYEQAYRLAGATSIIGMTDLLLNQIMIEVEKPAVKGLMTLGGGKAEILAVKIPEKAKSIGLTIQEIARHKKFPKECVFIGIYHEEKSDFSIPRGQHVFEAGETVCFVSDSQHVKQITDFLTRR